MTMVVSTFKIHSNLMFLCRGKIDDGLDHLTVKDYYFHYSNDTFHYVLQDIKCPVPV